jgi:hypothetical protein
MQPDFQPFDLQTLIDLLAEEMQKYTKAFTSGSQKAAAVHRATIDALIVEIHYRKKAVLSDNPRPDITSEKSS